MKKRLTLGTRGSELALWQARTVAARIRAEHDIECELSIIKTTGDRLADVNLSKVGGKQVFVKEIEQALTTGAIDLAVHSAKDLPAELQGNLTIAGVLPREDPRDAVVLPIAGGSDDTLRRLVDAPPATLRVGSGSVRRVAQLLRVWPAAVFTLVRGNVGTRLRQLDEGGYDLLILAAAGLRRLDHADRISSALGIETCVPAPGQGIVAIETRADDTDTVDLVATISDPEASAALTAERAVLTALGGGCQVPIGAYAEIADQRLHLRAIVASLDGTQLLRREASAAIDSGDALGREVARGLLGEGAGPILEAAGQPVPETGHA